jgi:signal transduction histidine kinase
MTLAVSTETTLPTPLDVVAELHEQVSDWRDPGSVAGAAVNVLRSAIPHAAVTIHRYDAESQALLVLATEPRGRGGVAIGARLLLGDGLPDDAVRSGETRRAVDSYVRPDFVRSLPGQTRSEVAVPIRAGSVVQGVIHLEYSSPHRPSDEDEALVCCIALHLAPGFAATSGPSAGDAGELEQKLAQSEELADLASHLAQNADLHGVLSRVADTALHLVPGECAVVLLRHESRQMLEVSATAGSALVAEGDLIPLDHGVPGQVARNGQPRACDDVTAPQEAFSPTDQERGIRNAVLVPLSAAGKTYGVLAILNGSGAFSAADVDTLQRLANQAAAIEAMRSVGPLRRRLSDGSLIAEVGRAVTGTLGLDEVLAVVVRAAEMLVSARCAAVALLSEDRMTLELAATSGSLLTRQGDTMPVHASLTGWAVLQSEAITSPGIGADPRRDEIESKLGPGVVIPIESGARIHGALLAARAVDTPIPSDEDVDALRKLAAYAAIAIENARLYREQTELSQALQVKTLELESAYGELRDSQQRLLVSEKMAALGRVTAGLAHEINSPLGGILNSLQMAQTYVGEYRASIEDPEVTKEDHEAIANDLTESLGLAEHATRKVAQFVRTIKGQTRIGDEDLRTEFEAADEIDGVISVLQHEIRSRHVTLETEIERDVPMVGDPGKFSLIVQNLLKNAIDAYEGEPGEVRVRWSTSGDLALLEVADKGCGIAEDIRGRIFDYLFTTKDIGQGTGLGLSTVHSIVTSHFSGEVDFESTEGEGTTFVVKFPISPAKD